MCGLVGIFHFHNEPVSPVQIENMTETLVHRGPDGCGYYVKGPIGFGHRRLSIIDLVGGQQPMQTSEGRFVMVYNGEIYNFRELRVELEALGYRFHTTSDSEVLLNAYVAWGAGCLERLNGMFAFAIYDRTEKRLFFARDRYGIKPLYYFYFGTGIAIASEVKALLKFHRYSIHPDYHGIAEYFTFQNFFTERTFFKDIHLLPGGCFVELDPALSRTLNIQRYWDFEFREDLKIDSREAAVEELTQLFTQAVQRQLVSDVEVGAYLSGGIDSGSISAVAARELPNIKSFTCGFDLTSASGLELGFDERAESERLSYLYQTEHYEMVLKAGDMERCLPRLAFHLEEPRIGQSYPNFYVSQLASKFVKVVLSGCGGDELFGGYPWRYYRAVNNRDFDDYISKYYAFWQRLLPDDRYSQFFKPINEPLGGFDSQAIFAKVFRQRDLQPQTPEDYINLSLYFEAKTFLHGLLVVEDKLSMSHSLETRIPFLDNDLVDFAMQLPVKYKLGNLGEVAKLNENEPGVKTKKYFEKTRDGKLLLRAMAGNFMPQEIAEGIKKGFSAPDASWFKGESVEFVKRRLLDKDAKAFAFFDKTTVQDLVSDHLSGKVNRRLLVWSLLNFEQWCDAFL